MGLLGWTLQDSQIKGFRGEDWLYQKPPLHSVVRDWQMFSTELHSAASVPLSGALSSAITPGLASSDIAVSIATRLPSESE